MPAHASPSRAAAAARQCFVIMPISDPDGYSKGHFQNVYRDLIKPACEKAGFAPIRADEVKQTNFIHVDVLQRLLEAPMAVCDLSTRNPNVLFELALRQAFDKPVALIQEQGTPQIFDIAPLRHVEYRKELIYREVLTDQGAIAEIVKATHDDYENGASVNSIIKLLALSKPAVLPDVSAKEATSEMLHLILSQLSQLRQEVQSRSYSQEDESNRVSLEMHRDLNVVAGILGAIEESTERLKRPEQIRELQNDLRHCIQKLSDLTPSGDSKLSLRNRVLLQTLKRRVDVIYTKLKALEENFGAQGS